MDIVVYIHIYIVFLRYHKILCLNNSTSDFCMSACMTVHEKGAKMITHSLYPEPWRMKVKWYWIFRYNYTKVYIINRYANGCIVHNKSRSNIF